MAEAVFMNKKLRVDAPAHARRRGRPPKFGRPAKLVAVTLPNDVVAWLEAVDRDLGRAIVRIHDEALHREGRPSWPEQPTAALVDVGDGRSLIVVGPGLVKGLAGVAAIPLGVGRAFLALEPSWTMADLELSVVDAVERATAGAGERDALLRFREQLRAWRTDHSVMLEPRAIIVASRRPAKPGMRGPRR
jgi:hypothetical protein